MANKPKTSQVIDTTRVSMMDVCQTPPHAIEPLLPYITQGTVIWESAAGPEQLLVKALADNRYDNVIATDLSYGEQYNYFTYEPDYYDIQITNVPFTLKYKWIKLAFERAHPFAFIVPYETTFAKDFQKLFAQYNGNPWLIEVLSPERRINFKTPYKGWDSSAQMPTCWLTWGLDVSAKRNDYLRTFYVPMRNVRYNDDNTEKE